MKKFRGSNGAFGVPSLTLTASALTVTDGAGTNDGTIGAITADASVIAAVQEIVANQTKIITDLGRLT